MKNTLALVCGRTNYCSVLAYVFLKQPSCPQTRLSIHEGITRCRWNGAMPSWPCSSCLASSGP